MSAATAELLTRARDVLSQPHGADPIAMATMLGRVRAIVEVALRELDGPTRARSSNVHISISDKSTLSETVLVDRATYLEGLNLIGTAWDRESYAHLAATLAYVAGVELADAPDIAELLFAGR